MAAYSMTYREVRSLPIEAFWMLNKNVDRIAAENDIRALVVAIHAQSGEGFKDLMEGLTKQFGRVFEYDEGKKAMIEAKKRDLLSSDEKADLNALGDLGVSSRRTRT